MSNICFNLNNTIDISNNYYIFNNVNNVIGDFLDGELLKKTNYGLYETSGNKIYSIQNIPKTHPIGFYDASDTNAIVDISHLIQYDVSYGESINIYVSKGSDLSFTNNNYYRFYDECYNLLNISGSLIETGLTNSGDNFYFMRSMKYTFIAMEDFSSSHPFALSGEDLSGLSNDLSLQKIDDSFNIIIPKTANNTTNRIFYVDDTQNDISGELSILIDASNISYYYGDISLTVDGSFETHFNTNKLSIKSFPLNGIQEVSNTNIFIYDTTCDYIVQEVSQFVNILFAQGKECLNIVSEAKLETSANNISYYEFNLNNHGRVDVSNELLYSLQYGLHDGSYTIFNIDENYPFTIVNNDFSNAIYVDEENTTGILHRSDPRIQILGDPLNTYNFYYGTVRIKLDNSSGTFVQNSLIPIQILNIPGNLSYEPSNNFVYTEFCNDPDDVNNITFRDVSFVLFNQQDLPFVVNDFSAVTDNIYYLNLYQTYEEPIIPYAVIDRYNHDISYLVRSTAPVETTLGDGTVLDNTFQINYDLSYFIITYTLEDYEKTTVQLLRLVEIRRGPYIEISGNYEIFHNSNPFTNRIDISTNTFDPSLNFFENLDVFVYDNFGNKINLPFEITVSGEFFSPTSLNEQLVLDSLTGDSKKVLKYKNINSLDGGPFEFESNYANFSLNYYLSKNFNFNYNFLTGSSVEINQLGLKIFDINNIRFSNVNSPILSVGNLIHINDGNVNNSYRNFIINPLQTKINSLFLDGDSLIINRVDNNLNIIDISQNYLPINTNYELNTSIQITNLDFLISISDINESNNNFFIEGSFNPINFFSSTHIDTQFIGNYEIIVDIKGLSNEDFLFNDLSNILDLNSLILDFSRTFLVNVLDNVVVELNFVNQNVVVPNPLLYEYQYSRDFSFNIFTDISFFKQGDAYLENTNIPLLELSDNSIYDGSLSFSLYQVSNISFIYDNGYFIQARNPASSAEAHIVYNAKDLCGNVSNDVSLNITFTDTPLLTLSGSRTEIISLRSAFNEPGLLIKGDLGSGVQEVTYVPSTGPYSVNFSSNYTATTDNPVGYDISWGLVLDITTIGVYELTYEVRKTGKTDTIYIKRFIEVADISNPFFRFPDLSHIAYIDGSNDASFVSAKDILFNNTFENTFNIDFSLTVFSSFDDLNFIINQFEVSDNYFDYSDLSTIITLSISGEGDISFNETGLRNVFSTNNGYLNSDNCLNKVTIGLNEIEPLRFNYNVIDACDNSFNITRIVDIVDKSVPSIDFSFDFTSETDLSFALFASDFKDFSYMAFNYLKDASLLIFELSSILFDFSLIDNYEIVNSNYVITISGITNNYKQENIKTIADISNDISSIDLFSKVDTSLVIIYEISDNQYNNISINRKVDIVNTIDPLINFINNYGFDDRIHINFGDKTYDLLLDFSLSHPRVFSSDISFDLSYILPPHITSLSGHIEYDPSAIIYSVSGDISSVHYDINFYSVTLQNPFDLSSDVINIKLIINNTGPSFNEIPYINIGDLSSINIIHEAGEILTDASLILGVNAFSEFDKFYYRNYHSDISYLFTNFQIGYDTSFIIDNPKVGFYTISYEAVDRNNQVAILERLILIVDTQPPIISISFDVINIDQFEELTMPSAFFEDRGSGLSRIEVDLSNTSNTITTDLSKISLVLTSTETYSFTSSETILNDIDTSNGTISYQIRYRAFDRFNNLSEKFVTVNISQTTNFVISPKLSISGYDFDLNLNFNNNFYNLINTDTANLSSIFDVSDIAYDAFNKTITYEVKKIEFFNLLTFDMSARYINDTIPDYNNTIINNILGFTLGTYKVLFQSFNSSNFESLLEVIDFTIVDTSPPDLSYVLSLDYEDISNIKIPLLSFDTYETLKTNPNYLENNNLFNPYYFTRDNSGNAMFSIPGINIVDILGSVAQSLNNETLPSIFDSSLSLFVTYVKDLSSDFFIYTINQDTSINFTQINQSTQVIPINPNLKDSAINVLIDHADVNPGGYAFTKFTYLDGTIHEFRHRGNGVRQFYNSTSGLWSGYYGLGDHSASVRTHTGNTSKNYLIECTVIVGVSTWTFRALDGGVSEVELEEDSVWQGLLGVEVKDIPIFDISTGYLLLNDGSFVQNYRAFDAAGNFSDISRSISVERFQPFINLNYTQDLNRNIFLKTYHQQFSAFIDPLGRAYDYYLGELTGNAIQTVQALPENDLGIHTVKYQLENYPTTTAERQVHVVNIKCLPITTDGLSNLITEGINYKYGLYNDKYRINIFDSSNAIRLFGYNVDISDLISICGENIVSYGDYEYHWGEVDLSVNGNFNRANIEYLNSDLSKIILEDIFLYTEECFQILINELLNKPLPSDSFRVDVSGYNDEDISYQFFTLSGELYPEFNDEKQHYITDLSRANLHLAMGKYTFVQDTEKNFYNRIKFSLTEDGTHNGGKEFTRGIKEYGLPGLSGGYTELIVSITTPSPLYYYSEHFPNMGGKIETRNNLVITAGNIYVNDNILTVDNSLVLQSFNSEEELLNRIILSQKFDIYSSDISYHNMHFNCITQQNINHNVLVHKDKNLLIFKKYQSSPNYDPLAEGVVSYVPSYDISNIYTNTHGDISNQNLLHDISNHYLFDCSVNQYQSYVFQYDYTIDTSVNILANLSINTLTEELAVVVGSGTEHTIAFSIDGGANWTGVGKSALDISGLGIGYNGISRFVAVGSGTINSIVYSDNGVNWFSSIDSKSIFDEYAKAVVYDNSNSYWLVGGKGSVNTLAYSSKGINWVGLGKTVFETQVNGFSKHNGTYILALGDGGGTGNSIAYSSDGLNWNGGTSNGGGNTKITFSVQGNSAIYYENQNLWLAVGEGTLNSIAYSTNGIDWIGLGKTRIDEGRDIDANDTMAIIVGKKYASDSYSSIIYSYDGIVWYSSETDIFTECNSIVWTGSIWIATGLGPTTRIATSRNGKNWLTIDNTINLFSDVGLGVEGFTRNTLLRDASDILYQMNVLDLFYSNAEIDNYSNYFRKNRLLSSRLVTSNFISKINELRYVNHVSLIDDNQIFDYFLEKYLTSSRIVFSHILDNFITFNLQTYIDLSNLDINRDLLNILYNEHFPLYDTSTNYVVDNSNLLFDEFVVNIWSDICGELPVIIKTEEESILLSNGLIELNEYLLDSKDSSGVLYKVYDDVINLQGLDYVNTELKNNVFLSVRDISMIGHDYNQYIGLTLQNIHHNMYIDESNVLIFHSYQNLTNNFKVNEPTLTLEKTIRDLINNKNYLLELSSNDIYGCFVNNSKNIYENSNTKNSVIRQDPINYKSFAAYFFDNELENNDDYLSQFDIRPISQNDICYNLYPYSYVSSLQTFHSHTYLIDLNDYFDRYIYDNSNLEVPYNVYNKSNLFYTIVDVSYLNEFNIFDVRANQNIIYDKSKIEILNYLQNFLVILNFKLDFVYDILSSNILYNNIPYSYDPGDYQFINDTNIQDLNTLYNSINFISTNYELTLPNNSLNKLFANNFYNTKQIKEKYLRLEQIFTYHQNNDYVNLTENAYDNIQNFNNIEQLATDISNINLNIDNILNNNLYYFYNQDVIEQLIKQTGYSVINNYGDLDLLHNLFLDFNRIKEDYDNIIFEFNARHLNESLFSGVNIIDYSLVDLYDISLINDFTLQLLNNFVSLDQVLRNQVQFSNIYIDTGGGTNNIPDTGFSYTYNQANVGLTDLSNASNFIFNNYNYFFNAASRNYDFINKERVYDDINYLMSGSKLLVNSFYSNNLEIRFDIKYNSFLYPDKYVDTIVLDLAIPDFVPPTLIFNKTDISFSQELSTLVDGSINKLLELLIEDISFIEINQVYDVCSNLTNIIYNDTQYQAYVFSELENNIYSTIEIDVRNLYNENTNFFADDASINIFYTVIDNANNINVITRTVNVERAFEYPEFFINGLTYQEFILSLGGVNWSLSVQQGTIITDEMLLAGLTATDPASGGASITINVENTLTDTNTLGVYEGVIIYTAISNKGVGITSTIRRDIIVTEAPTEQEDSDAVDPRKRFDGPCPCPIFYKPIQHNYKLGSGASNVMRLSRIILRK